MARDRERPCEFYINEGNCYKHHAGLFKKTCQVCADYRAKKGSLPRRKNLKKQKNIEWMNNINNFM